MAARYAVYRPRYPAELFDHIAAACGAHDDAWDAATGSGQAAIGLASRFGRVVASDASPEQVAHAPAHARISYLVASAEASALRDRSMDLVAVAQALHWLDSGAFFDEARRVARPAGIVAVWTYGAPSVDDPAADRILQHYARSVVGPYWPPERAIVDSGYRGVEFPFDEIGAPPLAMHARHRLADLVGYAATWSATTRYAAARGQSPIPELGDRLAACWGDPGGKRLVRWPLTLRIGRNRK